ncbi:hypothetical protein CTAYLR_009111 [Chrysophaeum taylorii]|uniref:UBX domain-containing protein n=1 Tax=Chrysophaeum taylorii TaxID=2483200 RepID=A0AAD7UJI6_9STRA|nr:hypothetical protein CTAYLR_009111 [Chrysophaeum taylorii]
MMRFGGLAVVSLVAQAAHGVLWSSSRARGLFLTRLRGGKVVDEVIQRRPDDAMTVDDEEGEVYVTLQFDPLRALYDVSRRVRWALGRAWRTLSRVVSSGVRGQRRRRSKNRMLAPEVNATQLTTVSEAIGSATKAAKVSRRRGAPVLVLAAKRDSQRRRIGELLREDEALRAAAHGMVQWDADVEVAAKAVADALGARPRADAFLALAVPGDEYSLRVLAVKRVAEADDAASLERWLSRATLAHTAEVAVLKRAADDAALVRAQAEELATAVEADEATRRESELRREERLLREAAARAAADAERRAADRRAEKAEALPPEPPATADACVVAVRDLTGLKHARRFPPDADSNTLFDWLDVLGLDLDAVEIKRPGKPDPVPVDRPFALRDELGRRVLLECVEKKKNTEETTTTTTSVT